MSENQEKHNRLIRKIFLFTLPLFFQIRIGTYNEKQTLCNTLKDKKKT